ncbi:MAG: T9SS type A sorting domain-containing protein [Bacteroidota bacterium]
MKKIYLVLVLLSITFGVSFGQADTLLVPNDFGGSTFGSLQKFILGDTTAAGERNNPERYYKLEKNKIYFLDGIFFCDFDLRLIADEVEAGEVPPIVASTAGADGVIQLIQFKLFGNGYIKNIVFQMTPPTGNGESNASFFLSGEGKQYEFDHVRIEWGLWTGMVTEVPVSKVVIRNCYFRNLEHKTNIWNGRGFGFYQENPADTVIMQNNTFFNMNSFIFFADISSIPPNYLLFDHNTIVNTMKFPLHSFWLPDAVVINNLFYNAHSYGENDQDVVGQDPDGLKYGIICIDEIPSDLIEYYGIAEGERKYKVLNNGFFYAGDIKDYWASYSLDENPFMNSRVLGMFDDDDTYPHLEVANTILEDPGIVNQGEGMSGMIQWMKNKRDLKANTYWGWDPDEDKFSVQWPFPEDLTYTNEALKSGAIGGFPVGDLNWWPAEKEEWEKMDPTTGVKEIAGAGIAQLSISPNPVKDRFTIRYNLPEERDVSITLYNLQGAEVMAVYHGIQTRGEQLLEMSVDNSLASGVYLLRLSDGFDSVTKKVILQSK